MIRRFLERRGHAITEAGGGDEALDLIKEDGFDRNGHDVRMPGIDGPTFFNRLADVAPELQERTIFMTGGFLEEDTEEFILSTGRPSIQKPFDLGQMAETVEG